MKIVWISLSLVALATCAQAFKLGQFVSAFTSIFQRYEEPPYTVTEFNSEFQVRQYPKLKWVCTEVGDKEDDSSSFFRLFDYINGNNKEGVKIEMTVPVTTEYNLKTSAKTMCFYIGQRHQSDPPKPENKKVFIEKRPKLNIITRAVGGYFRSDSDWLDEAKKLRKLAKQNDQDFDKSPMYWAGYDAPFKLWFRRNEVWLLKK
ncbi:heme-binding protein 2-like [Oratosquilla oratoria]|uniref:heme-binding protein 2-like n=1 Tax=Oratosquilla oratoria TaxID=337810 RepID=UPI003F767198